MADQVPERLRHLFFSGRGEIIPCTRLGRGPQLVLPPRQRGRHAQNLLAEFQRVRDAAVDRAGERRAAGISEVSGICIQFEGEPGPEYAWKLDSLDSPSRGIELLAVRDDEGRSIATVYVRDDALPTFIRKVEAYRDQDTQTGKPKNQSLVESISHVRQAVLEGLWTDDRELLPVRDDEVFWWEVWLRAAPDGTSKAPFNAHVADDANEALFRAHAPELGMRVGEQVLRFPERTVVLVQATREQLTRSVDLLCAIAEIRRPKETAAFFAAMGRIEQQQWIDEALGRIKPPGPHAPAVCLIDTGVNRTHRLLEFALSQNDMHTVRPAWGVDDRDGHGTAMAGLVLYGDLAGVLVGNGAVPLTHRLESVKLIPRGGNHHERHLYGAVTTEAVARPEVSQPDRPRVFCMAVTADDHRDRGKPSSWSAAVDELAAGRRDEVRRLIMLAAGNTPEKTRHDYPDSNLTDSVHDPSQAWNAITVGATTELVDIAAEEGPDWTPIAPKGDLSPCSCTSREWQRQWPIKPEVVLEGGNTATHPVEGVGTLDSLQLISTGHGFAVTGKPLVPFGDTSAATAEAARLCAMLMGHYPDLWPETVRALLVHSAHWSDAMLQRFGPFENQQRKLDLLRTCGYGIPDANALFWSARNDLTLVAQESLQPFHLDGSTAKMRDIGLHPVPWPTEVLREMEEAEVKMRVTLSYFVEPNPGDRGRERKFSYQSHGLRFMVKRPLEADAAFRQRVNKEAVTEEAGRRVQETGSWFLGEQLQRLGSVHSDVWTGTAAALADCGQVAVYPVGGWWKERKALGRSEREARYALVVSISAPEVVTDLYTPVATQIQVPV